MTKPGPHPWATNDSYAAGPDIGSDAKTVPLTAHMEDGYYRGRRPAPDILNWQLNRNYIAGLAVSKLQAMNWQLSKLRTINLDSGSVVASCWCWDSSSKANKHTTIFVYYNGATDTLEEITGVDGANWSSGATSVIGAAAVTQPPTVDADGDDTDNRVVVAQWSGSTDQVLYSASFGAWAGITWSGGAPGYEWSSVACDRDTAGGATPHWCIAGRDTGTPSGVIWSSTDGSQFGSEASAPDVGTTPTIAHSCHPVGAMGPDDTGNPMWIVASGAGAIWTSPDHQTWTSRTATGYSMISARNIAYSRPSRRWVICHDAADFGEISYSDDNGATWTNVQLPGGTALAHASVRAKIATDRYGTMIVTRSIRNAGYDHLMWVSVDEGATWTVFQPPDEVIASTPDTVGPAIEACVDAKENVDDTSPAADFFVYAEYDSIGTKLSFLRSLVV